MTNSIDRALKICKNYLKRSEHIDLMPFFIYIYKINKKVCNAGYTASDIWHSRNEFFKSCFIQGLAEQRDKLGAHMATFL